MTSVENACLPCNCSINPDSSIIVNDHQLCLDCAPEKLSITDITNNDHTFDILAENLELKDLINLKKTIKGVSSNINRLIDIKKREMLDKNIRKGEANFYDVSGQNYTEFRVANIDKIGEDDPYKMFQENIEFFGNPTEILTNYFNGNYDFFDTGGGHYSTFAELLYTIIGVDEEETKKIQQYILSGSHGLYFSNGDFLLSEIYKVILKTLVLEFESMDFFYYKVGKFIQKDPSIKVGDVFYAEEYMSFRPEYGVGLIGWDWESCKKILVTGREGQTELSHYIINKLIVNHGSYNMANDEVFYFITGEDEEIGITRWVLPNICLRITATYQINLTFRE